MPKTTTVARKFSVEKTKKGLLSSLYLVAGLFIGGLAEQYAISKIAFLADTKSTTDAAGVTTSSKNTVGVILKSAIYIVGGLIPSQVSNNEALKMAGYGISAYGGLKLAKSLSETAKVYGLGQVNGLVPHFDPPALPYNGYAADPNGAIRSW